MYKIPKIKNSNLRSNNTIDINTSPKFFSDNKNKDESISKKIFKNNKHMKKSISCNLIPFSTKNQYLDDYKSFVNKDSDNNQYNYELNLKNDNYDQKIYNNSLSPQQLYNNIYDENKGYNTILNNELVMKGIFDKKYHHKDSSIEKKKQKLTKTNNSNNSNNINNILFVKKLYFGNKCKKFQGTIYESRNSNNKRKLELPQINQILGQKYPPTNNRNIRKSNNTIINLTKNNICNIKKE